jgi:hypothetical protein
VPTVDLWLLAPCGHRCVCGACAAMLRATPAAARKCPICGTLVESSVGRVFEL